MVSVSEGGGLMQNVLNERHEKVLRGNTPTRFEFSWGVSPCRFRCLPTSIAMPAGGIVSG